MDFGKNRSILIFYRQIYMFEILEKMIYITVFEICQKMNKII